MGVLSFQVHGCPKFPPLQVVSCTQMGVPSFSSSSQVSQANGCPKFHLAATTNGCPKFLLRLGVPSFLRLSFPLMGVPNSHYKLMGVPDSSNYWVSQVSQWVQVSAQLMGVPSFQFPWVIGVPSFHTSLGVPSFPG